MSHNLALRSPAERMALAVDLLARRLLHKKKDFTKCRKGRRDWEGWASAELMKLEGRYQQPVRDRLNALREAAK
jgi:hypothetical protein